MVMVKLGKIIHLLLIIFN